MSAQKKVEDKFDNLARKGMRLESTEANMQCTKEMLVLIEQQLREAEAMKEAKRLGQIEDHPLIEAIPELWNDYFIFKNMLNQMEVQNKIEEID